ncbi:hypothetical protein [Chryseobacterium sp. MEBOG07]|uniref:hypothetical protein n=1 Tax=Chryseobacterium sp. MEBOG07 TaxID=2879939 RepID=UPI001F41DDD9|nr:hypothetical protein [Chryseobacterium sp. MEBOG07]UKB78334.1 hypothetical protein LF886_17885 [Chryseobacterium sp. MEBOG07]
MDIVSTNKGILIPRVSAYPSSPVTGLMVYRTDLNGFYAWNGSVWTQSVFGGNTNLYNTDGALSGNRIVSQARNSLSFTGNLINAFSVDGTTFSIDVLNDKIGI